MPRSTRPKAGGLGELLARLADWLAEHRPRYLKGLRPGASDRQLEALGFPVPDSLRQLLQWHNGQKPDFIGSLVESWRLMSTIEIGEAKRELAAETGWQAAWIPFLDDDAGDYVCLNARQPNVPVREYWLGKQEHPVVAPSLEAWFAEFVAAVERGEYEEDPERGTFLRKRG